MKNNNNGQDLSPKFDSFFTIDNDIASFLPHPIYHNYFKHSKNNMNKFNLSLYIKI